MRPHEISLRLQPVYLFTGGLPDGVQLLRIGRGGLIRSLKPSEMLEQVYTVQRLNSIRISHVVVMGTGEPLDNYDALIRFLKLINHEKGQNMSLRNITVSTCGLVEKIEELAKEDLPITLAISLHAVTDEKRRTLMPVANRYSISQITKACNNYFDKTGRRITFEYSLISGINDNMDDADKLAGSPRPAGRM